jgi:hypothetical protein
LYAAAAKRTVLVHPVPPALTAPARAATLSDASMLAALSIVWKWMSTVSSTLLA